MLASDGYAVVDGFLGASAAEALLAEVEALHQAEPSPFTQGRTGGGAGGGGRKFAAPVVRGDVIAVLGEGEEGKVAGLGGLLRQVDELVKCMAHSAAPELLSVTSRSQPMLACYPGNGSRYVRHIDNPGGGWGGGGGGGGGGRGGGGGLLLRAAAEGMLGKAAAAEAEMLSGPGGPVFAYCPVAAKYQ